MLDRHRHSNTFRKNSNRFRNGDGAFTVSGGRRRKQMVEEQNEGIQASLTLESTASWALWSAWGNQA
jgi:hypothetical protein